MLNVTVVVLAARLPATSEQSNDPLEKTRPAMVDRRFLRSGRVRVRLEFSPCRGAHEHCTVPHHRSPPATWSCCITNSDKLYQSPRVGCISTSTSRTASSLLILTINPFNVAHRKKVSYQFIDT